MPKPQARSLRFTKFGMTNWRNFRSVKVTLQLRAFFVGPNASGKSNLLDAVRFLAERGQEAEVCKRRSKVEVGSRRCAVSKPAEILQLKSMFPSGSTKIQNFGIICLM
jgi:AAA15 family ATPase/GTPase